MKAFFEYPEFTDYNNIRLLNETGGISDIFIGHKIGLDVTVVIKRTRPSRGYLVHQDREANILKNLKHQYLPRIYDMIVSQDGYIYTVMDFIPGMDLKTLVQKYGPVDEKTTLRWAKQLCEVTAYLHSQTPPIIHCDIKPANVMITPEGNICLIDFNTSVLEGTARSHTVSNGYAAPEQYVPGMDYLREKQGMQTSDVAHPLNVFARSALSHDSASAFPGQKDTLSSLQAGNNGSMSTGITGRAEGSSLITVRTDIYAMGATLYYMVSGRVPEKSLDPITPLYMLRPVPVVSMTMINVISRAMQKDAALRFPDADAMRKALNDVTEINTGLRNTLKARRIANILLAFLWAAGIACCAYGAVSLKRESESSYLSVLSAGDSALANGNFEAALTNYQCAISSNPDRIEGYIQASCLYYYQGKYQLAIDTLEDALHTGVVRTNQLNNEEQSRVCYIEGVCYYELGDYASSIEKEAKAVFYNPSDTDALLRLAMAQARNDDPDAGRQTLDQLQEAGASTAESAIVLAEIESADGNHAQAHTAYQTAIQQAGEDVDLLQHAALGEAQLYAKDGDVKNEIAVLNSSIPKLPEGMTGLLRQELGDAYCSMAESDTGNSSTWYQKAAEIFQKLLDDGSGNAAIMLNLAAAKEGLGDIKGAQQTLLEASDIYNYDYRMDMRLAFLYAAHHGELGTDSEDLAAVQTWYTSALQKYDTSLANGNREDPDMIQLENFVRQLQENSLIAK